MNSLPHLELKSRRSRDITRDLALGERSERIGLKLLVIISESSRIRRRHCFKLPSLGLLTRWSGS